MTCKSSSGSNNFPGPIPSLIIGEERIMEAYPILNFTNELQNLYNTSTSGGGSAAGIFESLGASITRNTDFYSGNLLFRMALGEPRAFTFYFFELPENPRIVRRIKMREAAINNLTSELQHFQDGRYINLENLQILYGCISVTWIRYDEIGKKIEENTVNFNFFANTQTECPE
jgi:hypothetical protein